MVLTYQNIERSNYNQFTEFTSYQNRVYRALYYELRENIINGM